MRKGLCGNDEQQLDLFSCASFEQRARREGSPALIPSGAHAV
jgi:hypothetical protein